jgi:lysophospholipase L1-like esterase
MGGAGGALGGAGGAGAGGAGAGGAGNGGTAGSASGGKAGAGGAGGTSAGAGGAGGSGGSGGGAYRPCPTNGDPCRILPFGDSITDGFNIPGGYRMKLFSLANQADQSITFVGAEQNGPTEVDGISFPRSHEGHSGWKIAELLARIPDPAFDTLPHIVLLMIGTNDCIQNDNLAQAPARLENLLNQIIQAAPDALVVVAKLTPLTQNNNRVTTYNDALPAIVDELADAGKHIVLVDQYTGFQMNQLADGIHPNQSGYDRMAGVWYEAIEPLLP